MIRTDNDTADDTSENVNNNVAVNNTSIPLELKLSSRERCVTYSTSWT
jgi:hypothetical protein